MKRLEDKVAVVTGGSAGIGFGIARALVGEGAHVYVTGRRQERLDEAVAALGSAATGVVADVTDLAALDRLYARVAEDGRRLDVVVANAGGGSVASLADTTVESLAANFDVNVRGTLFTVQKALPLLDDGSSVILVGSVAAVGGAEGYGAYAASKAALPAFARTWANELRGRGIRVNVIAPGAVHTAGLLGGREAQEAEDFVEMVGKGLPLGRVGRPEEVGAAAVFLASSDSSYTTGSTLYVDGGSAQF